LEDDVLTSNTDPVEVEGESPSTEILQLVVDSLAAAPDRADLWMMRFEVQKTLGLKKEFAEALIDGWKNPRVMRQINWAQVRLLWQELAPGEPVPGGIKLPEPVRAARSPGSAMSGPTGHAQAAVLKRRFSDVATYSAGRELAVLSKAYAALHARPGFLEEAARKIGPLLQRPTPLQFAEGLSRLSGGTARIFLKREDLRSVTPEQENATAQAWLATKLGRPTVITGNDVDAHSLALATASLTFGLKCIVVVKPEDITAKAAVIERLRALGAQIEVNPAYRMLTSDPREGALRMWQRSLGQAHLALSLGTGPSPYPAMINNTQSLLGRETEMQLRAAGVTERPRTMIAAVQSEADSIGFMLPSLGRPDIELMYAEPTPGGPQYWRPSARLHAYNGAIREHAWLKATGRVEHIAIGDDEAMAAQQQILSTEKVNVSLEDARAVALCRLLLQRTHDTHDYVVLVA
jgi:tryptophan synthase beta chain